MLAYFRKWTIALKRRRLKKQRTKLQHYSDIETNTRSDGSKCHNCSAPLTGPFCHICGQRDDDLRRPIWTFFRELFNAIFDTDSKIIKTIILLVAAPGALSRAFMEGKRARFLPPFRLYVVLLFIFFSTLNIADVLIIDIHVTPRTETSTNVDDDLPSETDAQDTHVIVPSDIEEQAVKEPEQPSIEPPKLTLNFNETPGIPGAEVDENLTRLINALGDLRQGDRENIEAFEEAIEVYVRDIATGKTTLNAADLKRAQDQARTILEQANPNMAPDSRNALQALLALNPQVLNVAAATNNDGINFGGLPYNFDFAMFVPNDNVEREGIKQEDIDSVLNNDKTPEIAKKLVSGFTAALKSPREFNKLFNEWLPYALVVLMPVFAFILRITHWGKRRYYLNQLVFALHFHSFLFVMLTVFAFIVPMVGGDAFGIFWMGTSVYLIIALKVGQNQGWIRAFLKAGFIWVGYFAIMVQTMFLVMLMGISDTSVGEFFELVDEASNSSVEQAGEAVPAQSDKGEAVESID